MSVSTIFYAVSAVSGGVSLVAFIYACLAVVRLSKDQADAKVLLGVDDAHKAQVIDALRDRLHLKVDHLTKVQVFDLAKRELERQATKEKRQFILLSLGLLLTSGVAAYSINAATADRGPVTLTFRAVTKDGGIAFSDRGAKVTVVLPSGVRSVDFTKDGQAVISGVPREYLGTQQEVLSEIYYYKQEKQKARFPLKAEVMDIAMEYFPEGTPEGRQIKSTANLMLLKLLSPYRVIAFKAAKERGLEVHLDRYCTPEFRTAALSVNLNAKLSTLGVDLQAAFDVITEQEPTAVPRPTDTLAELLDRTAVGFKAGVNLLSGADPLALDPKIRRELNGLAGSGFVGLAASGTKLAFPGGRLHEGFLRDLCTATASVKTNNVLNPFSMFYSI